jgi:antitoxin (DNA-binding transcriptional repressor) of toxin-antitoxin stability system
MGNAMTIAAAAARFDEVVRRAHDLNESTLLLKDGQPMARIVPAQPLFRSAEALAHAWQSLAHLDPQDAEEFAADVTDGRARQVAPKSQWE